MATKLEGKGGMGKDLVALLFCSYPNHNRLSPRFERYPAVLLVDDIRAWFSLVIIAIRYSEAEKARLWQKPYPLLYTIFHKNNIILRKAREKFFRAGRNRRHSVKYILWGNLSFYFMYLNRPQV